MARNATTTSADTAPGEGDPNISRPMNVTASSSEPAINPTLTDAPTATFLRQSTAIQDATLYPGGSRSLSGIAVHAFSLGLALATSILLTIHLLQHQNPLWRLPSFIAILSLFHFLEFYTTAAYNLPSAKVSSFLLFSNGRAYNIAHTCAMLEIVAVCTLYPSWLLTVSAPWSRALGLALVVLGQGIRSLAMMQAGTNFNHIPAKQHREGHELVTKGIYGWLRHPSYFGFFWWAIGTQLLVGNAVCGVAYVLVLWKFFSDRIRGEEEHLVQFFGEEYVDFRKRTGVGIPFIR
ncbi:hypothetical protein MBLNU457_6471t1 [Dothideomycetes sp. NU457]